MPTEAVWTYAALGWGGGGGPTNPGALWRENSSWNFLWDGGEKRSQGQTSSSGTQTSAAGFVAEAGLKS